MPQTVASVEPYICTMFLHTHTPHTHTHTHTHTHRSLIYNLDTVSYIKTITNEITIIICNNKILSLAGKWIELEIIMLSEISKTEKDKYHMFSHMRM
jgi:hypothetical protein